MHWTGQTYFKVPSSITLCSFVTTRLLNELDVYAIQNIRGYNFLPVSHLLYNLLTFHFWVYLKYIAGIIKSWLLLHFKCNSNNFKPDAWCSFHIFPQSILMSLCMTNQNVFILNVKCIDSVCSFVSKFSSNYR